MKQRRILSILMIAVLLIFPLGGIADEQIMIDPELSEIAAEFLVADKTTLTSAVFDELDAPKDDVDITVNIGTCWDEDDIVRTACDYAVQTMQKLWDIPSVNTVFFFFTTDMTDSYGNTTSENIITLKLTREGTAPVNYEKFIAMVHKDYNALLQVCDSANIIRPLYDSLKLVQQWW